MDQLTRRGIIKGIFVSAVGLAGGLTGGAALATQGKIPMTIHRDPNCGCCHKWAAIAERSGFAVTIANSSDIMTVKTKLGVPSGLIACHTTEVGGYVVEGHVPMASIHKLLREKPKGIAGIALPGMPAGSPGMETPGGGSEPLIVRGWDRAGTVTIFPG